MFPTITEPRLRHHMRTFTISSTDLNIDAQVRSLGGMVAAISENRSVVSQDVVGLDFQTGVSSDEQNETTPYAPNFTSSSVVPRLASCQLRTPDLRLFPTPLVAFTPWQIHP